MLFSLSSDFISAPGNWSQRKRPRGFPVSSESLILLNPIRTTADKRGSVRRTESSWMNTTSFPVARGGGEQWAAESCDGELPRTHYLSDWITDRLKLQSSTRLVEILLKVFADTLKKDAQMLHLADRLRGCSQRQEERQRGAECGVTNRIWVISSKIATTAGKRCNRRRGFHAKNESSMCDCREQNMQHKIPESPFFLPCLFYVVWPKRSI